MLALMHSDARRAGSAWWTVASAFVVACTDRWTNGAGRGIDLVVDKRKGPGVRTFRLIGQGDNDGARLLGRHRSAYLREVTFGHGEIDVDRPQLGDGDKRHRLRRGVVGLDQVTALEIDGA